MTNRDCPLCNAGHTYRQTGHCAYCLLDAIASLPDPDCDHCWGSGEYYTHSPDCVNDENDFCVLAGGYWDCAGQVEACDCSFLDKVIREMSDG